MIAWFPHRAAVLVVVSVIGGLVAGCGGTGRSGAISTTTNGAITRAQAVAYARAVNLRVGDIPLGTVYKPEREVRERGPTRSEEACFGGTGDWHRLNSPIINRESATIGWTVPGDFQRIRSAVEVMPTASLMIPHNAELRKHRFLTCYLRFLRSEGEQNTGRAEYGRKVMSRLPDPLPGIAGAYEYRIVSTVIMGRKAAVEPADYLPQQIKRFRLYEDLFGFISGPAEINMTAISVSHPVLRTVEDRLLVLLYSRTREHRL